MSDLTDEHKKAAADTGKGGENDNSTSKACPRNTGHGRRTVRKRSGLPENGMGGFRRPGRRC